jgi:hypothetical protein
VYTLASNGHFGIGIDAIRLDSACAALHFTPNVISSLRFKQNVLDMGSASDALMQLRPVTFRYKPVYDDGSNVLQYGLIAEEVAKVYPDMVQYDQEGKPLAVRYNFLAAMLLEQVQKQHATIAEQTARLESQAGQLAQQKAEIAAQQKRLDDLGRQQAEIDALRQQLERLAQAVSSQQGSTAPRP